MLYTWKDARALVDGEVVGAAIERNVGAHDQAVIFHRQLGDPQAAALHVDPILLRIALQVLLGLHELHHVRIERIEARMHARSLPPLRTRAIALEEIFVSLIVVKERFVEHVNARRLLVTQRQIEHPQILEVDDDRHRDQLRLIAARLH